MKYTQEKIDKIERKLLEMPEVKSKKEHSKQETVKILYKAISEMQKRGYTLEQIAETLSGEGLQITTPTLKSYLQRAKPAAQKRQTKKQKESEKKDKIGSEELGQQFTSEQKTENNKKATFTIAEDSEDI